ncbi:MAG: hypothetical protein M5U12_24245 [Verrucomicrobia bacterium]|nr:hypothetical protein [Verrucomicrobiota bacterium]
MNKSVELLLQLEGLGLVRKSLRLAGPQADALGLSQVEARINKLRRKVPGRVLSLFGELTQRYPDPVSAVADGRCQGVSSRSRSSAAIASWSQTVSCSANTVAGCWWPPSPHPITSPESR